MNIMQKQVLNLVFVEVKKCVLEDRRLEIHLAVDRNRKEEEYIQQTFLTGEGVNKLSVIYFGIHPKLFKTLKGWLEQASFKTKRLTRSHDLKS